MARNHVVIGAFVDAKMVPAIGDVYLRQAEHWNLSRVAMLAASTMRADEAIRPAPSQNGGSTLVFRTVKGLELGL